jgi:hypothetical protein
LDPLAEAMFRIWSKIEFLIEDATISNSKICKGFKLEEFLPEK